MINFNYIKLLCVFCDFEKIREIKCEICANKSEPQNIKEISQA